MFIRLLSVFMILLCLPVFAGELEDALKSNSKIFLYLYMDKCTYCEKFKPIQERIAQKYNKKCAFVKVDATTDYGVSLMKNSGTFYVPSVILLDYNKQTMNRVVPQCMLEYSCLKDAVDEFIK